MDLRLKEGIDIYKFFEEQNWENKKDNNNYGILSGFKIKFSKEVVCGSQFPIN